MELEQYQVKKITMSLQLELAGGQVGLWSTFSEREKYVVSNWSFANRRCELTGLLLKDVLL